MIPRQKFLFADGCVAQAVTTRNRTTLTLYFNKAEVMALDPYFTEALALAILGEQSNVVVPAVPRDDLLRAHAASLTVRSRHTLHRLVPGSGRATVLAQPHVLDDGCFYWLRASRRRRRSPAKKAKK